MTLLMVDGVEDSSSGYVIGGSFVAARNGLGYSMNGGSNGNCVQYTDFPAGQTWVAGGAFNIRNIGASNRGLINFVAVANSQEATCVICEANGSISGRRSYAMPVIPGAVSAPGLIQNNQWFYLEVKATLGTTDGALEARINNTVVFSVTNVNTAQSLSPVFAGGYSGVGYGGVGAFGAGAPPMTVDDVYFCNAADPYLGDCVVETLYANGNGAVNQWIGSDGNSTDNYLLVDEVNLNTSDYVKNSIIGQQELFAYQDLSVINSQVLAVGHFATVAKTDSGAASFKLLNRGGGGTITKGPTINPTTNSAPYQYVLALNPDTGLPWTIAEVNALQSGIEIV